MKLKLNNGKELDVKYWSFAKCYILSGLGIAGIIYGALAILVILLSIASLAL